MSFWDYAFDSDYKQRTDIETLKQHSLSRKRARSRDRKQVRDLQERVDDLEDRLGEVALLCRSLLTVLREEGTIKPEHLHKVMQQIDAEDGTLDGKLSSETPSPDDDSDTPEIRVW